MMNIREVLRLSQAGTTDVEVARLLGCHRMTVAKYRKWAEAEGLRAEALPDEATLAALVAARWPEAMPPQATSQLSAYADEILALRERGVRMTAIAARLSEWHGIEVSYEALRRLVRRLKPPEVEVFVRIEVGPGEEGQVDFGYAGLTLDPATGKPRKTWVFVMVLSHSRHMYAELVYDQSVGTWLSCHIHAFEFFGGVPARIVLDNLKAAILRHCADDLVVQRSYRELAEHYGFIIDPNPPRRPNLKGKVERGGVDYIKNTFLAGRDPEPTDRLGASLRAWCAGEAGWRTHGTTRRAPLAVFETVERAALGPLPRERYDLAVWKKATLHRDCHLVFEKAYYSVPFRYVSQELLVRGGLGSVRVYTLDETHSLLAAHPRAKEPGERHTHPDHLPPQKLAGLDLSREACLAQATAVGSNTAEIVRAMLDHRPENRLRSAGRLLALGTTVGEARLEAACARALHFGEAQFATVKSILDKGLDAEPLLPPPSPPARTSPLRFARRACEYMLGARLAVGGAR